MFRPLSSIQRIAQSTAVSLRLSFVSGLYGWSRNHGTVSFAFPRAFVCSNKRGKLRTKTRQGNPRYPVSKLNTDRPVAQDIKFSFLFVSGAYAKDMRGRETKNKKIPKDSSSCSGWPSIVYSVAKSRMKQQFLAPRGTILLWLGRPLFSALTLLTPIGSSMAFRHLCLYRSAWPELCHEASLGGAKLRGKNINNNIDRSIGW